MTAVKLSSNHNSDPLKVFSLSAPQQVEEFSKILDEQGDTHVSTLNLNEKSIKPISTKTLLSLAAESGDLNLIEFLAKSCDINELDTHGNTALAYAAGCGNLSVVKLLIKLGAKVDLFEEPDKVQNLANSQFNESDELISYSPLMIAVANNQIEVCKILLESGAQINLTNREGYAALSYACQCGNAFVVNLLIESGADINIGQGFTPLMWAASFGHLEVCKILISRGADATRVCSGGSTALNYAQELKPKNYIEIIDLIKKYSPESIGDLTPLAQASKSGDLKEIELLAKSCDINEFDKNGQTALAYAAEHGQLEAVKLLVELGAKVDLFKEPDYEEIKRLSSIQLEQFSNVEKYNSDSIIIPVESFSPLMFAASKGHVDICQFLLDAGANINLQTAEGISALIMACCAGQLEVCLFLLENGANAAQTDSIGMTAKYYTEELRPKKHKTITNHLQKLNPESSLKLRYVDVVKTLSHSLSIGGESTLRGVESFTFAREGKFAKDNYQKFARDIKQFCHLFPGLIPQDVEKKLRYSLQIEADSESHPKDRTYNRFIQGEPVFIESGWSGFNSHAVCALLWNEYLIISNRGAAQRKNIEIFRLSKDQMEDPDIIKQIRKAPDIEFFVKNIYTNIASKCDPKQSNDEILENSCALGDQRVGNCAWASLEQSVFMFLVMSVLKNDLSKLSKTEIQALVNQQKKIFKNFCTFQQLKYLEEYGQLTSTDENLIESDFVKIVSANFIVPDIDRDSKLTERVNEVFSTHFPQYHPNKLRTDMLLLFLITLATSILLTSFLQKLLPSLLQSPVKA